MEHKFNRENPDGTIQEIRFDVKHEPMNDELSIFIFDGNQGTNLVMPRSEFITLNTLVHATIKINTMPNITPGTLIQFCGVEIPDGWELYQDLGKNHKLLEYVGDQTQG